MNSLRYMRCFYGVHVQFSNYLGIGKQYVKQTNHSKVSIDTHIVYEHEILVYETLKLYAFILTVDHKTIRVLYELYNVTRSHRSASYEQIDVHVDLKSRKASRFPDTIYDTLKARFALDTELLRHRPTKVCRRIRVPLGFYDVAP